MALTPSISPAGKIFDQFPSEIDPATTYVFYSHGLIVEGDDPEPVHPSFGKYEFPAIRQTLADAGFNLISHHRPANTDPQEHAIQLATEVRALLAAGVPANHITLLGFSRGGQITILASGGLADTPVNTILMASCSEYGLEEMPNLKVSGAFLSIYETSDRLGSCATLANRSSDLTSFDELAITTGLSHGAFYTPINEWTSPVIKWIKARAQK